MYLRMKRKVIFKKRNVIIYYSLFACPSHLVVNRIHASMLILTNAKADVLN